MPGLETTTITITTGAHLAITVTVGVTATITILMMSWTHDTGWKKWKTTWVMITMAGLTGTGGRGLMACRQDTGLPLVITLHRKVMGLAQVIMRRRQDITAHHQDTVSNEVMVANVRSSRHRMLYPEIQRRRSNG